MPRALAWWAGGAGLLLAGIVADTRYAPSPLRAAGRPLPPDGRAPPHLAAAVLLQQSDCTGNLRLLDLLHRGDIADRLRLQTIWYVGPSRDTAAIRALLPPWASAVALVPASRSLLRELRRLGHASTPILLLYDQEGRVRLTSQSPRSLREFAGLRRAVEGLSWIEEL